MTLPGLYLDEDTQSDALVAALRSRGINLMTTSEAGSNHRQVGGAISEFHELFVVDSSYYERLRWIRGEKPIYYRQAQLVEDVCDRMLGRTAYGKMFSKLTKYRRI